MLFDLLRGRVRLHELPEGRLQLDCYAWRRMRHDHVVVLWGDTAAKFWRFVTPAPRDGKIWAPCLCNCLAFALWATCEHEHCVRALDNEISLSTPGQSSNRGGRGQTNVVHAAKEAKQARRPLFPCMGNPPARAQPCIEMDCGLPDTMWEEAGPVQVLEGSAQQRRSDDHIHAGPALQRRSAPPRTPAPTADPLKVALVALSASEYSAMLARQLVTWESLRTNCMSVDMLWRCCELPVGVAALLLQRARESHKSPGVATQTPTWDDHQPPLSAMGAGACVDNVRRHRLCKAALRTGLLDAAALWTYSSVPLGVSSSDVMRGGL